MSTAASVERRIAALLADEALVRAPEGALTDVLTVVDRTTQRRGTWRSPVIAVPRIDGQRRLILALAAALLLAGMVVAGAVLLRPPDPLKDVSSLVIVEHQPYVDGAEPRPVSVLAVAADGTQRPLMTIQPAQLDGTYSEWYAGLSVDGHLVVPTSSAGGGSVPAILDVRDPSAHAVTPDAEGAFPHFGPDGRIAMSQNDGRVALFDPSDATTSWIGVPPDVTMSEREFGPIWTADGGLLASRGGSPEILRVDPATLTVTPSARVFYAGLAARRVDPAGHLLRCDAGTDDMCDGQTVLYRVSDEGARPVWNQKDDGLQVTDFAWAVDGGIWILAETRLDGPRTVELRHVSSDGHSESIATLAAGPDDPDPSSYSPAGRFAAFSKDDARIIVGLNDPSPTLWAIDPRTHRMTRLPDGLVAGWLGPDTMSAPRPTAARVPELPEAIRGEWADATVLISVRQRSIDVPARGTLGPTTGKMDSDGNLAIVGATRGCPITAATYGWTLLNGTLHLSVIDDACSDRVAALDGSFERALGHPDTGSLVTIPGTTYLAPDFAVPFRVTMPPDGPTLVGSHQHDSVDLHGVSGSATVMFLVPKAGVSDGCGPSNDRASLGSGLEAYLAGLSGARSEDAGSVTIGGAPTRVVRLVPTVPGCTETALFWGASSFHPFTTSAATRIAIVKRGATEFAVLISSNPSSAEEEAWVSDLLGSIEWLQ